MGGSNQSRVSEFQRGAAPMSALPRPFQDWFAAKGWQPRPHQLEMLEIGLKGESTLLISPTGGGKTLAGFLPTLVELARLEVPPSRTEKIRFRQKPG